MRARAAAETASLLLVLVVVVVACRCRRVLDVSPPTNDTSSWVGRRLPPSILVVVLGSSSSLATTSTWGELGRVVEAACEVREKMMIGGPL
jgi:hypothetical protein